MQIGINLLLWTVKPTVREHGPLLEQIKAWGFDGVEFPVGGMEERDATELDALADDLGLGRTTLVALSAVEADPTHPDAALRRAAVAQMKTAIDRTRALGAELLVGPNVPGPGAVYWNRSDGR